MILLFVFNSCFFCQSLVGHGLNRKNESKAICDLAKRGTAWSAFAGAARSAFAGAARSAFAGAARSPKKPPQAEICR